MTSPILVVPRYCCSEHRCGDSQSPSASCGARTYIPPPSGQGRPCRGTSRYATTGLRPSSLSLTGSCNQCPWGCSVSCLCADTILEAQLCRTESQSPSWKKAAEPELGSQSCVHFESPMCRLDRRSQGKRSDAVAVDPLVVDLPILPVAIKNAMLGALPPAGGCPHTMKAGAGRACESLYLEQPASSVRTFATACWRTGMR